MHCDSISQIKFFHNYSINLPFSVHFCQRSVFVFLKHLLFDLWYLNHLIQVNHNWQRLLLTLHLKIHLKFSEDWQERIIIKNRLQNEVFSQHSNVIRHQKKSLQSKWRKAPRSRSAASPKLSRSLRGLWSSAVAMHGATIFGSLAGATAWVPFLVAGRTNGTAALLQHWP